MVVTPCWEEGLAVNGSGLSDVGLQLPPQMASVQAESWTSMTVPTERQTSEPSVWSQDMEGTEKKSFRNHKSSRERHVLSYYITYCMCLIKLWTG